tara:strand:+ start:2615 stop:4009 length:1395 start_codon:yes stop_codon:yes gene_type:complete
LFKEERLYRFFCYSLVFIIFLNAIFNILFGDKSNSFDEINFFDIFAGLLLFIYLYAVGNSLKNLLRFDNVSLGITFYLFSFFIFDCIILFFYQKLSFLEILLIVNFLWLSVFILKLKSLKNVLSILIPFISLRLFIEEFNSKLTINNNIRGDVEAVFFDQAKNIYESSYFVSINNFVFEGYPQFISYIQAIFLGISSNISTYNFFSFTSHIVFYLSLLFFIELNLSNFHKIISVGLFSILLFNSSFLQFLFSTSLMSEGLVSLFTAILIITAINNTNNPKDLDYKIFLLLGVMYFSKQFNSTLIVILTLFLFLFKGRNKLILFGLSGVALKELLFLFVFSDVSKDHHIRQMDIQDTVLDLLLFRDLKIQNIFSILQNLWIDKPLVILFFIFYFSFIYSKIFIKKFELQTDLIFTLINLNVVFVFLIYISVWQNMELESPIRYFLNNLHLLIISTLLSIESAKNR